MEQIIRNDFFKSFLFLYQNYPIWVITRCAETGRVSPASGVIVNAVELPAGFLIIHLLKSDVLYNML